MLTLDSSHLFSNKVINQITDSRVQTDGEIIKPQIRGNYKELHVFLPFFIRSSHSSRRAYKLPGKPVTYFEATTETRSTKIVCCVNKNGPF